MSHFSTSFCFSCPWASGAPHGAALQGGVLWEGVRGHGHLTGWARRQSSVACGTGGGQRPPPNPRHTCWGTEPDSCLVTPGP